MKDINFPVPLKVLHNSEEHPLFPAVLSSSVPNAFEADCWVYGEKIWVHHDRRLWKSPILYGERRFTVRFNIPALEDFFLRTRPGIIVKLDIKYSTLQNPEEIALIFRKFFQTNPNWKQQCFVCADARHPLLVRELQNKIDNPIFLTIHHPSEIFIAEALSQRFSLVKGVSVSQKLFPQEFSKIKNFIKRGLYIDVWTINNALTARQLLHNGVHAITSDDLDVLNAL